MTVEDIQRQLRNLTSELRAEVATVGTNALAIRCSTEISLVGVRGLGASLLKSPAKGCCYILDVMLSTDQPREARRISPAVWERLVRSVNEIFELESELYAAGGQAMRISSDAIRQYVAINAFVYHHLQGPSISTEDAWRRLRQRFEPFDTALFTQLGISHSSLLDILAEVQNQLGAQQVVHNALVDWNRAVERGTLNELSVIFNRLFDVTQHSGLRPLIEGASMAIDQRSVVRRIGPENWDRFLEVFSTHRKESNQSSRPGEMGRFERQPLIVDERGSVLCPYFHGLLLAVIRACEEAIEENPHLIEQYRKHRASVAERLALDALTILLPTDSIVHNNFSIQPDGTFEHDLLIETEDVLLVVEVKSSPPRRAQDDVERTYLDIRRSFTQKAGIQGGYNQASRLRSLLEAHEELTLFKDGVAFVVKRGGREVLLSVVTADDYALLSTTPSLFLDTEGGEYPWVVSLTALKTACEAFADAGISWRSLVQYIRERREVEGLVFCPDELEFLGLYLHTGAIARPIRIGLARNPSSSFGLNPELAHVATAYLLKPQGLAHARPPFVGKFLVPLNELGDNE